MKNLSFDYYMQIDYTTEVARCNYTIKCLPKTNARQIIQEYHIEMCPPCKYQMGEDGLHNLQIYGLNEMPHKMFYFRITGRAEVGNESFDEYEDEDQSMIFRHPYGMNVAGERIKEFFDEIAVDTSLSELEKAEYIMKCLHAKFEYKPFETDVYTTAEEAFTQGYGVCQDYAHIFIALLHLAGIPARYVTGLIVGEGASHAWVEILYNGKWYGIDPTNNTFIREEHIKIGVGRDAHDCMINRGIMHGGGFHLQTIKVDVKEIGEL